MPTILCAPCLHCGRLTANRGKVCVRCLGGPRIRKVEKSRQRDAHQPRVFRMLYNWGRAGGGFRKI